MKPHNGEGFKNDPAEKETRTSRQDGFAGMHKGVRRIPSKLLGKVLDHGKESSPAVKLLAIKAAKGPNFTLREEHVYKRYGVTQWQFRAGLRVLRKTRVLERWQSKPKDRAQERLADAPGHCTLFPEAILTEPAKVVAFYLAASLSTEPRQPAEIAKRIGIARSHTVSMLRDRAIELGLAWNDPGPGRKILIARYGFDFGTHQEQSAENGNLVQKHPAQKHPAQNQRTKLCKIEGNSVGEETTLKETVELGELDDFPKERKNRHPTEDFSQHKKRPKGGQPHLDQSLADPTLEGYLDDGWQVSENDCPDFLLAEIIRKGTDSRVGWALLESEGLDTARWIVGALTETARRMRDDESNATSRDLAYALGAFHLLLRQHVGDKPGQRWLNSYDLLVLQLYGVASGAEWLDDIGEPLVTVDWPTVHRKQMELEAA